MKRKRQVILEVTFNLKTTELEAVKALQLLLQDRCDLANPIYLADPELYCEKLTVKSLHKVIAAGAYTR